MNIATLSTSASRILGTTLADFLFRKKGGWCEYFATSAAILLRTEGTPTRYVSGFNVIGSQRKGDYYLVRDWDRHAWIEAYTEGRGWVEYDPTPGAEYESLHSGEPGEFWSDAVEWVSATLSSLWLRLRYVNAMYFMAALGLALAACVLRRFLKRGRRVARKGRALASPKATPTGLEALVATLDRRAAELGYPRPKARAPLEHWKSVPGHLLSSFQRDVGVRILERFYRARFGGIPVSPDEARSLAGALETPGP